MIGIAAVRAIVVSLFVGIVMSVVHTDYEMAARVGGLYRVPSGMAVQAYTQQHLHFVSDAPFKVADLETGDTYKATLALDADFYSVLVPGQHHSYKVFERPFMSADVRMDQGDFVTLKATSSSFSVIAVKTFLVMFVVFVLHGLYKRATGIDPIAV